MKYSESITWITLDEAMPDAEQTVLLSVPAADDPVWFGWWTGEEWHFIDGMLVEEPIEVVAWAQMPQGVM